MLPPTILSTEEKLGGCAIRWAGAIVALLAVLCFSTPVALGDGCSGTAWNFAGSGNWSTGANWNPTVVPNSSSTNVCITNGTSTTVTLDNGSTSVANLTLGSNDTLNFNPEQALFVYGTTINNAGQIIVNSGAPESPLYLNNSVVLSGGGTVTLNTQVVCGACVAEIYQNGAYTLTTNNTIQGEGEIDNTGATLTNQATINANSPGGTLINGLYLEFGTVNNNAGSVLEATNNGLLYLYGLTINNAGGTIESIGSGASVLVENTTIHGGTLGGALESLGISTLDGTLSGGLTLASGTYTTAGGNSTIVSGTIYNNGNFLVNGGGGHDTFLDTTANTTLQGGGTVTLSTTASVGGYAWFSQNGAYILDNVNNTIQGEGFINLNSGTLTNEAGGTINANHTSGDGLVTALQIKNGFITNSGLMEATNNGVLTLAGTTINNAGGSITSVGGGASVEVDNTTIQGGTLNNNSGGTLKTLGTSVLDGSTQGALTLSPGSTYSTSSGNVTQILGTINNQGNFVVKSVGGNPELVTLANTTLSGGGTVTLITTTAGGSANISQNGLYTLDNVNNTIQGEGLINLNSGTLTNEAGGTINANSTGSPLATTLEVYNGNITNGGLMEATHNGVLQLVSTTINNSGGNITSVGGGASVQVYNTTIQGGTLNSNSGGTMETLGTSVLDGSAQGTLTLSSGSAYTTSLGNVTQVLGTLNNQGSLQVYGGGGYDTYLETNGNTTLQGGGMVTLSTTTTGGGGNAWLSQNGAYTLDNVNNTIQGEGVINLDGGPLNNEVGGTIIANSTGSPLTTSLVIEYGTVTNNGTLQADSGNLLHVTGGASFTNFSGSTLTGGTYNVYGTLGSPGTLQIDALGSGGGEIVNNAATILLDGPNSNFQDGGGLDALSGFSNNTASGSFTIQNGRNLTTPGNFANAGNVTVGNNSTLTIGSGGTNNLSQSAGSLKVNGTLAVGTATINAGTLSGGGTIVGNVTNAGGTVTASDPGLPDILTITGNFVQSSGVLEAVLEGPTPGTDYSQLDVTGTATLGGTLDVNLSFDPTSGENFYLVESAGGIIGTFADLDLPTLPPGDSWNVIYNSNNVDLTFEGSVPTPEPSIFLLLVMGIAAMTLLRKYRNPVWSKQG